MLVIAKVSNFVRLRPIPISALMLVICAGLIVYARTSHGSGNPYNLANDLPRGPLVYAQFKDLPALIKQWDESRLKQQYLATWNYEVFQHGHLALKLVQRWEEFNSGLGFPLDTASLAGATDAGGAIAIYDIGRLDLVLIAPLSDEKLAATRFFTGKEQFEESESPDGSTYYRREIKADRGRQKQVLAFAAIEGRFILATNEQLLLRVIANINRKAKKDSLADDPAFRALSAALTPHFATVWVDQAKLNEDYYFKHYWLMGNVNQLRGIRAGLFDLELQDNKWIERREFLTAGKTYRTSTNITSAQVARLRALAPEDTPFFRLQSLGNDSRVMGAIAADTLFDGPAPEGKTRNRSWSWRTYEAADFYASRDDDSEASYDHYSSLNRNYDSTIDDPHDARVGEREEPGGNPLAAEANQQFTAALQQAIGPARPQAAAVMTSPHTFVGPLFAEFRRVAIIDLQAPGNIRRETLESTIASAAQSRLTIAGPSANLQWESRAEGDRTWRELKLPMLGWEICYAVRDHELIFGNSAEMLKAVLANRSEPTTSETQSTSAIEDLTIIRLDQRKQAFDDIMNRLDAESIKSRRQARKQSSDGNGPSEEFFSGNIASLLNVTADVRRIEIKRSSSASLLHEELDFVLK